MIDSTLKRIDEVLGYLTKDRGRGSVSDIKQGLLRNNIEMAADELLRHLNQLVQDGYVKEENNSQGIGMYAILTSGAHLSRSGGYSYLQDERERMRVLEIRQNEIAKRMLWANWIIAFGTAIAAVYYLTQIFGHHCH